MIVVVVATESCVALELFTIPIDVVAIVELTGSSDSLVLSRDTSHGFVFFYTQSLSGCASSMFLTLVVGQTWCLVNIDMLDPKNAFLLLDAGRICCSVNLDMIDPENTFLSLEWVHTLRSCLINLRSPPVITSYSGDWPRVISPLLVVSSHWLKMTSIMDGFLVYNVLFPLMGSWGRSLAAIRMMRCLGIYVENGNNLYHFGVNWNISRWQNSNCYFWCRVINLEWEETLRDSSYAFSS